MWQSRPIARGEGRRPREHADCVGCAVRAVPRCAPGLGRSRVPSTYDVAPRPWASAPRAPRRGLKAMGLGRGHGFLAPAPWPLLGRTTTWPTRYDSAGVALTHTCHPPRSSILSLSVAYLHGRPGSRSAGGRGPSRSVPALGVCLRLGLRVRFTGPRSCVLPARLYVVAIAARPVLGARRAFARPRYRLAHRLARRAALWCVLAPAVPRRCVGNVRVRPI
jgi:hypothetical protein